MSLNIEFSFHSEFELIFISTFKTEVMVCEVDNKGNFNKIGFFKFLEKLGLLIYFHNNYVFNLEG